MALSPSIPTSFVPRQPVATGSRRYGSGGNDVFLIVGIFVIAVTIVIAIGTFLFAHILVSTEKKKGEDIVAAQKVTDPETITQMVRLQNRLSSAHTVLSHHIALTQFFNLLETITAQTVHFDNVDIAVADDRTAKISMTGIAQNFNALASQSTVFATQKYIKDAVFSNIAINKNNNVSFSVSANLDPAVIVESTPVSQQVPPVITDPTAGSAAALQQAALVAQSGAKATTTATTTKP